jgi:hypothetical protein
MKITLELDKLDALAILSAVEDAALSWGTMAAISTGDEREYAQLRARTFRQKAREIIDALNPEEQAVAA